MPKAFLVAIIALAMFVGAGLASTITGDPRYIQSVMWAFLAVFLLLVIVGVYQAYKAWGLGAVIFGGIALGCIAAFLGLSYFGGMMSRWGATVDVAGSLGGYQGSWWQYIGTPALIYLLLLAVAFFFTRVMGASGWWALLFLAGASYIGALRLEQTEVFWQATLFGAVSIVVGTFLSFFSGYGGNNLVGISLSSVFQAFLYLVWGVILAQVTLSVGYLNPQAGQTVIAGYLAGAGFVSYLWGLVFGGGE